MQVVRIGSSGVSRRRPGLLEFIFLRPSLLHCGSKSQSLRRDMSRGTKKHHLDVIKVKDLIFTRGGVPSAELVSTSSQTQFWLSFHRRWLKNYKLWRPHRGSDLALLRHDRALCVSSTRDHWVVTMWPPCIGIAPACLIKLEAGERGGLRSTFELFDCCSRHASF